MSSLLFVVSGLFLVIWIIGLKGYYAIGANITPLLVMAAIAAVMAFFERMPTFKRKVKEENS